jgi:hypothetical protein
MPLARQEEVCSTRPIPKRNLIAPKSSIVGEISFLIIMQLPTLLEFTGGATMTAKCE